MKVVIVAKTRMGRGACVGAINFEGRSLRLIAADQDWNEQFNRDYAVGDVWDVNCIEPKSLTPPHVENVVVHEKRRLPPLDDSVAFIEHHIPPQEGGIESLFEGLTASTKAGTLYISEENGVPPYSTMFWRPDRSLILDDDGKRLRYRYPTDDGGRTLTFVGYQDPLPEIPAGTLLRVSLAHWWRPDEMPEGGLRCYVQLSGWFLDSAQPDGARLQAVTSPSPPVSFPSTPQAILNEVFGFNHFRTMQQDIVDQVLEKQDTLAVMPTGSGKSLCFQLPALLFPGLTVVVSPLISLMEDQVSQLRELSIPALYLNSTLTYEQYLEATRQIRAGEVRLLYAAPETLLRPETLNLLDQIDVDCLTIDEAHCISEWGHDFRPEYRQLVDVRHRLPQAVCLAVTATATEQVRDDIKNTLAIPDAHSFVASFDRDNLYLAVEQKTDALQQTIDFLEEHKGESGIIYCATRKQVDQLTALLAAHGWDALPYHAGLDGATRKRHQRRFVRDDTPIIVATVAFGMGINKSNVRFILHYDLPKNLESYYQQIGRAGRDGLQADCLLLYSYADVSTVNYFIEQQAQEQQRGAQMRLESMLDFVETASCRRVPLLAYFGETYDVTDCGLCDNCMIAHEDLEDLTVPAQKFLSCVKRTGEIFGANHIINILRGSQAKSVLSRDHDQLSTYNIGREYSKKAWKKLARQFVDQGLLVRDRKHGSLKLTQKAYDVFRGEKVQGIAPEASPRAPSAEVRDYDVKLFDSLRERRKELADAANLPAYMIFSDRSLAEMARFLPISKQEFAQIHGVGNIKLERYAEDFLSIIENHADRQTSLKEAQSEEGPPRQNQPVLNRTAEIAERFSTGQSVETIAGSYAVKTSTVINHLWKAFQAGLALPAHNLLALSELSAEQQQDVMESFAQLGNDFLGPVHDKLDESVSYYELGLIRLHMAINDLSDLT